MTKLNIKFPSEKPPKLNINKENIISIPNIPIERYAFASFSGRIKAKIFDPSSGGMGIRLKIAKRRFSWTAVKKNQLKKGVKVPNGIYASILKIIAEIIARSTFVPGPASETRAISFLPSRKLKGSMGTGFAPPNINVPPLERNVINGNRIVIYGSI